MRDIPLFTTENGIASLTLNQIPYSHSAWIRIQDSLSPELLLKECMDFCTAVGAEHIYASGHSCCEKYPMYTQIILMQADIDTVGETEASLFPVTEDTLEQWRSVYNEKIPSVPNGSWMTIEKSKEILQQGSGYFVHRNGALLGTGIVSGNHISWVASLEPGAGADVVRALCHAVTENTVNLEVASANWKALSLYEKLGFIPTSVISVWYQVK